MGPMGARGDPGFEGPVVSFILKAFQSKMSFKLTDDL